LDEIKIRANILGSFAERKVAEIIDDATEGEVKKDREDL
jgi:hypothetical protein